MINWTDRARVAFAEVAQPGAVKTDKKSVLKLSSVSSVPSRTSSEKLQGLSSVLSVPFGANSEKEGLSDLVNEDPDRWCWPQSPAMNRQEIITFNVRLSRFRDLGLSQEMAERTADRLTARDRDHSDQKMCLECDHLRTGWHCMNARNSGLYPHSIGSKIPKDFVDLLQRCDGFTSS